MGAGPPGMALRYRSDAFTPDSCQRLYLPGEARFGGCQPWLARAERQPMLATTDTAGQRPALPALGQLPNSRQRLDAACL